MSETTLKDKTAKGLFWGGVGNGIQQILNLLFGIFLARMLTPADYGMIGMLSIFIAIANNLQESGFIITLANRKTVNHDDYNSVFWFSLLTGIILYIILFFTAPLIASYYRQPEITPLARFLFLSFVISSTMTAQSAYLFKNLMIKEKAISQFPALVISGSVGIIMAYNGMSYWGIATQSLLYIAIISICFWYFSPWRPTLSFKIQPIKEMFGFSSKVLLTNIFTQINNNIFSAIIGRVYTPRDVGLYTQSNKWNYLGASLISGMINSVAQPVLSQTENEVDRQQNIFRKMLQFTTYLSFPVMLGLALIAPEFISITITDKWAECVPLLQMLCIWGAFMPIVTLYTNLIMSHGKSNIYMWNTIATGIIQIVAILLLYPYGLKTMIAIYVIINCLWLVIWHYFANKEIRISLISILSDILPYIGASVITMAVTYFITLPIEETVLLMLSKIIVAAVLYFCIMRISGSSIQKETISYLLKKKK